MPVPAGTVAVIDVAEFTVNEVAATPPNFTSVASVRPTPVIVTVAPAAAEDGDTDVICGQVPAMPFVAQANVGYAPLVRFQVVGDHGAGDAPVNVDAVCMPAVAVAPVAVVVPASVAVVVIPEVDESQNDELYVTKLVAEPSKPPRVGVPLAAVGAPVA